MLFAMSDRYITVVVSFALFHIWHGGVNRWNVPTQIADADPVIISLYGIKYYTI
jgi:hypothetical protein